MQWVAGGPGNVPGRDLRPRFPDNQRQLQMAALSLSPARPTNQVQLAAQPAPGGEKPWWRNHGGETLVEKHSWGKRFSGEALVEKNFDGEAFRWRSTLEEKHSGGWRDIALAKLSWGRNHVGEKKMPWSKCASYF